MGQLTLEGNLKVSTSRETITKYMCFSLVNQRTASVIQRSQKGKV